MTRLVVLLGVAALGAGGAPPWHAPQNAMQLTRQAGLTPETHEFVFLHVHAHLDIFVNGKKVLVPAGIGLNIQTPAGKYSQGARRAIRSVANRSHPGRPSAPPSHPAIPHSGRP